MMGRQIFGRASAATAIALMTISAIANIALSVPLKDGDKINGFVRGNAPTYQFKNLSRPSSTTQVARGEEHTFTAQRGDSIEVSIEAEDGSTLKPTLVLYDPSGRQVVYSESPNFFKYQVVRPGTYRLLVLGRNGSLGRYSLAIDGLTQAAAPMAQADQVMQNVLRLRTIGCGIPNVARIKIGAEERCTRDIDPGTYSYEEASRSIKLVDARRDMIARQLQLTMLDRCPSPATSVAQITLTDSQDGRDYTYCATPNRYVQAGNYRYNPTTDALTPLSTTTGTTPPPITTAPQPFDPKRQMLQTDYGLTVLDNCPAARTSYVVVNFPEADQTYQYCANPNRVVRAGEYTYNTKTSSLDPVTKPTNCTINVGGICLVK